MGRRFRRWPSSSGLTFAVLALLASVGIMWRRGGPPSQDQAAVTGSTTLGARVLLAGGPGEIVRVLDGRSLVVRQGSPGALFRVQLLGVAPLESKWQSPATEALAQAAPAGPAYLELDKRRSADDGSWLAYVYVNNRLLSDAVIRAGWGRYDPHSGDSFATARLLRESERLARDERRGMWAGSP